MRLHTLHTDVPLAERSAVEATVREEFPDFATGVMVGSITCLFAFFCF
jgi:hypothetical protein